MVEKSVRMFRIQYSKLIKLNEKFYEIIEKRKECEDKLSVVEQMKRDEVCTYLISLIDYLKDIENLEQVIDEAKKNEEATRRQIYDTIAILDNLERSLSVGVEWIVKEKRYLLTLLSTINDYSVLINLYNDLADKCKNISLSCEKKEPKSVSIKVLIQEMIVKLI